MSFGTVANKSSSEEVDEEVVSSALSSEGVFSSKLLLSSEGVDLWFSSMTKGSDSRVEFDSIVGTGDSKALVSSDLEVQEDKARGRTIKEIKHKFFFIGVNLSIDCYYSMVTLVSPE